MDSFSSLSEAEQHKIAEKSMENFSMTRNPLTVHEFQEVLKLPFTVNERYIPILHLVRGAFYYGIDSTRLLLWFCLGEVMRSAREEKVRQQERKQRLKLQMRAGKWNMERVMAKHDQEDVALFQAAHRQMQECLSIASSAQEQVTHLFHGGDCLSMTPFLFSYELAAYTFSDQEIQWIYDFIENPEQQEISLKNQRAKTVSFHCPDAVFRPSERMNWLVQKVLPKIRAGSTLICG